jgi:two-component system sensor histidine kinase KdpD
MKKPNLSHLSQLAKNSLSAVLIVTATTFLLLIVRRDVVGEGVVALVFLVPVIWAAYQWGLGAGMSAALTAGLTFDFLFIPPYFTFTIGSLEGWLILIIFFAVAIIVVERIQSSLSRAQASEREAIMMYELSSMLANARTDDAIVHHVARFLHERYLATLVTVSIQRKGQPEFAAFEPNDGRLNGNPDCILPILNRWGLVGEVQIWRGDLDLPSGESRIFRNFTSQIGQALERVQFVEAETRMAAAPNASMDK